MRKLLRRGACAIVPVILLAACGTGGESKALPVLTGARAQRWIAASADQASAAGTARIAGHATMTASGRQFAFDLDGAIDFRTGAFQFGIDTGSLQGLRGGFEMELRLVDGVAYMQVSSLPDEVQDGFERVTGGKSWIKIDPAAFGLAAGSGFGQADPGASMDALRGVDDVTRVGEEEVRGEPTVHYRGTVDVAKAMAELPESLRGRLSSVPGLFGTPWAVDVWIDADGRTRKMAIDVDTSVMSMRQEIEFFDFGADVDLSAPPADDVADFAQVFGNLGLATPRPAV
jgi:hypothetical protein